MKSSDTIHSDIRDALYELDADFFQKATDVYDEMFSSKLTAELEDVMFKDSLIELRKAVIEFLVMTVDRNKVEKFGFEKAVQAAYKKYLYSMKEILR